jgi:quercetin dioxygenase-like cupin family protein
MGMLLSRWRLQTPHLKTGPPLRYPLGRVASRGGLPRDAQDGAIELLPDQIKWTALPPDVTSGATWMLLVGPLDKPVHYTLRVHLEKGGMVTPHTHPDARYVTVLSGEVYAGMGDTVNEATSKRYPAGSFFVVPPGHVHYSWAKDGEVTYQESGIGPTSNAYLKK